MSDPNASATSEALSVLSLRQLLQATALLVTRGSLRSADLAKTMRVHFGGSDAAGHWDWRMAYDVMQAAANLALKDAMSPTPPRALAQLAQGLLTETRRSEDQIRLQQFSTPLPYAALVAHAACVRKSDLVLEPSAGTGSLAAMAVRHGADILLNEIDPFRAALLEAIFDLTPSIHDGEHIDDLLLDPRKPSVVLMNPPFSSSIDRSNDPHTAAKHLVAASKRLAPGGRLVAIMPARFTAQSVPAYWTRLTGILTPRLALNIPGSVYRKMGTTVDTQVLICDKVALDDHVFEQRSADTLEEAFALLDKTLPERSDVQPGPSAGTRSPILTINSDALRRIGTSSKASGLSTGVMIGPKHALAPVAYDVLAAPRENPPVSDIYARYAPQRIDIAQARSHPTPLVESLAMASVAPPAPAARQIAELQLPKRITSEGVLSDAQLETIIMANDAHERNLPGKFTINDNNTQLVRKDDDPQATAYRLGYFLGDGTGCGKGRQVAGLILAGWLQGRRRAVWVSKSATLIEDAVRDWHDLGGSPADIQSLSKWKPEQDISMAAGILFVTYATLRSAGKGGNTRLDQILKWLGPDFDGVISFDEAHAMQNAAGSEEGRGTKPSQQGLAGLRLQLALPRARIFYVSATGATNVHNLAYASRLGLWGQGADYPFPSRESFVSAMEAGGVAAMEVVARDLKALGLYTARALSFDGVEYDVLEHALSAAQIKVYDAYARAFKTIHQNLDAALEATGVVDASGKTQASSAKAAARSRFESTKQRFFNHLLMGMKAPSIIAAVQQDVEDGWAAVVQIVSTGESLLKRRLDGMDPEDELVEGALTPRDYVLGYLEQAFPIHTQKLVEIDGNVIAEPLRDANGDLVVSREALGLREEAMVELMSLAPIPAALDQILWAFGADSVAEVTGRSLRPLKGTDGTLYIENRSASANSSETGAFMGAEKNILIFSDAGGTGRSYHAAENATNQKRRRHYLLEPGWRADAAIQGLGRTHRSAQVSAPFFRVCTSDVHGEKRFTATIARRLDNLGALTKGQRETGGQGMFREEDNLESPIARHALRGLYADLAHDRASSMRYETFTEWTALNLMDGEGVLLDDLPPIQRFLNRVLALPIHMQNALFEEFMERIATQTARAREAGTLDLGVETLRGDQIVQTSGEDLWTCPQSHAVTRIIGLEVTNPVHVRRSGEALERAGRRVPMINHASGRVALIDGAPMQIYDEDVVTLMRKTVRPTGSKLILEEAFEKSAWEEVDVGEFARLWDDEADALPREETTKLFLLTGLLLPIWKDIPTRNERIYRVSPRGGGAMIGRTLSEDGAAALRARFMKGTPQTPNEMLTVALGSTTPVDLGHGLYLRRRRVAGETRLEIEGADGPTTATLKSMGCFTEIIAFQLRLFVPHGEGADTSAILARITGQSSDNLRADAA
ncbi:strawberry notch family protein [Sulfitobacter sp. F26204]|uniref:strawberry notch-like NTP hydrolase domain-containing protein n=1 Tax=Sulfitobacter sp. F26204 TaxID=2996014 RepID=UPI00225E1104|nr:strawberry notch family protein [Sulfitobacter sp. F26204]MCX7561555.1 strawberry notch family protein [Sulfitobacter sp. F26204]